MTCGREFIGYPWLSTTRETQLRWNFRERSNRAPKTSTKGIDTRRSQNHSDKCETLKKYLSDLRYELGTFKKIVKVNSINVLKVNKKGFYKVFHLKLIKKMTTILEKKTMYDVRMREPSAWKQKKGLTIKRHWNPKIKSRSVTVTYQSRLRK